MMLILYKFIYLLSVSLIYCLSKPLSVDLLVHISCYCRIPDPDAVKPANW